MSQPSRAGSEATGGPATMALTCDDSLLSYHLTFPIWGGTERRGSEQTLQVRNWLALPFAVVMQLM